MISSYLGKRSSNHGTGFFERFRQPRVIRIADTTVLNRGSLRRVLAELSLKDRLILELDMNDVLRPGELFGLRWRDFNYDECLLELHENCVPRKASQLGQNQKSAPPCAHPERAGRRSLVVEAGIQALGG